jgi:hypothetical protein
LNVNTPGEDPEGGHGIHMFLILLHFIFVLLKGFGKEFMEDNDHPIQFDRASIGNNLRNFKFNDINVMILWWLL